MPDAAGQAHPERPALVAIQERRTCSVRAVPAACPVAPAHTVVAVGRAGRQAGLRRQIGSRRLSCTWRQAGLVWQAGALRLSGAGRCSRSRRGAWLLLSLAVRCARRLLSTGAVTGLLLLSGTIWRTRLQLSGPDLSGRTILPDLTGLKLPVRTVWIDEIGIGSAEFALLEHHLASEILRGVELSNKTLVAQSHRLRNRQRHRGEAHAAEPARIVKPLAPCVRKPSRAPARSLTSIWPTLPSASG